MNNLVSSKNKRGKYEPGSKNGDKIKKKSLKKIEGIMKIFKKGRFWKSRKKMTGMMMRSNAK